MRVRIVEATPLDNRTVHLRFQDGAQGTLDVAALIPFDGVFAPLQDPSFFVQVHVDQESGTIAWPGNLDLDPYTLYVEATGKELRLNDGTVIRPSMAPPR